MARKVEMTQIFDDEGHQLPITIMEAEPAAVVRIKSVEKDGYSAVQVGYGVAKENKVTKPVLGMVKALSTKPRKFVEERMDNVEGVEVGQAINIADVLQVGDFVAVTGLSKGKGFQGGVKRWGFGGGPKTHGQSDRLRAPGSIGAGTSPGRVWKGKKMAGRMGGKRITTAGLRVVAIEGNKIMLKGAVPGARESWVLLRKQG